VKRFRNQVQNSGESRGGVEQGGTIKDGGMFFFLGGGHGRTKGGRQDGKKFHAVMPTTGVLD